EAADRAADARKASIREAAQEAERLAEEFQRPFEQAASNIQSAFADAFTDIFRNGIKGFDDFADKLKDIFASLLGELATLAIKRAIIVPIIGAVSGMFGMGGGAIGGSSLQNALGGGGFGGIGQSFSQFGTNIGSFFGFGGSGGTGGGVAPPGGIGRPNPTQPAGGPVSINGFSGMGILGGAFMGAGIGSLTGSLTGGNSTGSMVGGAIGGGLGSFFGPIGSLLGGVAGGALGGLFGGNGLPDFSFISGAVQNEGDGTFTAGRLGSKNASIAEARDFIQVAADALGAVLKELDLEFTGSEAGAISRERHGFVVIQPGNAGRETFSTPEKAIEALIVQVLRSGEIAGQFSDVINRSLDLSGGDLGILESDLRLVRIMLGEFDNFNTNVKDAAESLLELKERAEDLGLTATQVATGMDVLSEQAIRDLIGGLIDFRDALLQSDLAPGTPMDRFLMAQERFLAAVNEAELGTPGSIDALPGAAAEFLNLARAMFASGPEFAEAFQQVQDVLNNIIDSVHGAFAEVGFAGGGLVTGRAGRDALLTPVTSGEFIIQKSVVDRQGVGFFNSINAGNIPGGGNTESIRLLTRLVSETTQLRKQQEEQALESARLGKILARR
ncbi:MAG: hypothetical protein V3S68_02535, partial [Dehalococcoidia bacterium]